MKGDQMGTLTAHPSLQELSLSNWTWFKLVSKECCPELTSKGVSKIFCAVSFELEA